jgi:hypothetical protein
MTRRGAQVTSRQISKAKREKILAMTAAGRSARSIANELETSERTVRRVRADARGGPNAPEPKQGGDLPEQMRPFREWWGLWRAGEGFTPELLEEALEAFRWFFVTYSGKDYLPRHAESWLRAALVHDRLLLNVPPRHAKSEIITQWFTLALICVDRNVQILIVSQTQPQAKKFSNKVCWLLEFHRGLIRDFGRFKPFDDGDAWRPLQGEIMVAGRTRETESGDMTLQVRGAGQNILGMEADVIIGDDPVGRDSEHSEAARETLSIFWAGDVMTRLAPRSKAIVIGQCIHAEDLYAELAAKAHDLGPLEGQRVWHRERYPAVIDWDEQQVLWPEEWPFVRLMQTRADLRRKGDDHLFMAMYQQEPISEESRIFRKLYITGGPDKHGEIYPGCLDLARILGEPMPPREPAKGEAPEKWIRTLSVDPSPEKRTGLIVADVLYHRTEFHAGILEARSQRLTSGDLFDELERVALAYGPQYLVFEQNAFARWFLQDPRFIRWDRKHGIRVIGHTTGRNKSDAEYGVRSLRTPFVLGRIRIPWGDEPTRVTMTPFVEEVTNYPYGSYDDQLMALWFLAYNFPRFHPTDGANRERRGEPGRGFKTPPRLKGGFHWQKKRG